MYTLLLKPGNDYEVLVDAVSKHNGTLYDDFDLLPARKVKDDKAVKPESWDERATLPDETDVKPDGYDDIPAKIVDDKATKPDDWDEEDDGAWEAPLVPNPAYKGPWVQKSVPNPAYSGVWSAPEIDNPEFKDDPSLYAFTDLGAIGIELWQVKAGSLFDNLLVTDEPEVAAKAAADILARKAAEKAAFDIHSTKAAEEAAAKAKEAGAAGGDGDDADDDDEDAAAAEEAAAGSAHDEL